MQIPVIEAKYPLNFRKEDAKILGDHLKHRNSVNIIGMKRVGISNFLRFFLHHKDIVKRYISQDQQHLFITVDLNDLVERELFPFWTLTLKRIVDQASITDIPESDKKAIESLFIKSIQLQDLFLAIDSVRQALGILISNNVYPTIFFIRFDRIKDTITPAFFDNLQGLRDASHHKLSFVFTSYRSLHELVPKVFTRASLSVFCQEMHIKLAKKEDARIVYRTYKDRYQLTIHPKVMNMLLDIVCGNVQYIQLALIFLREHESSLPNSQNELFSMMAEDERISLHSEELWESLSQTEQHVLLRALSHEPITADHQKGAEYLWDTGFVNTKNRRTVIFSPLLEHYLRHTTDNDNPQDVHIYFSKKEHDLFSLLHEYAEQLCDRERIVEVVWPESKEFGVSDWAIDRLVARLRVKLKEQNSPYEIKTIRTRGYQLIKHQNS